MRVSTANLYDGSVAQLMRRQIEMQTTQVQLTSGKKVAAASDDPTGAARVERALTAIGRAEANQRALEASRNSMILAEGALGDGSELLQQIRESLVAAGNASYGDAERVGLAAKIAGLRDQLLSIANRPDGSGGYIFSGQGASQPPFLDEATGVRFNGVAGTLTTGNMDNFALTVDGRLAWEQARSGNGSYITGALTNSVTGNPPTMWIDSGRVTDPTALTGNDYVIEVVGTTGFPGLLITNTTTSAVTGPLLNWVPGKSVEIDGMAITLSGTATPGDRFSIAPSQNDLKIFPVLDRIIGELRTPLRSGTEIHQGNAAGLRDIDQFLAHFQNVRSLVGEQLNLLDGTETRLAGLKLYNQSERSAAEDLDMTEAISRFETQKSGYDAALRSYAAVQRLTLFQYLNF
ncbi:flagellar hook-associated protein FlgL [Inhella gelatinilytica]|uniref:Flagellar hook-associated protein FlgL n=1 Tax=Inhella gelatinilytica TaxID=2795030 RepID=A0A931NED1_9BURK|nr:flagellar hook-associated protein FlgL [Inhella gelatinilytica]MBH9553549.1 flagellar hook-associated protein FlgL [Inhella gelatinilytica]